MDTNKDTNIFKYENTVMRKLTLTSKVKVAPHHVLIF